MPASLSSRCSATSRRVASASGRDSTTAASVAGTVPALKSLSNAPSHPSRNASPETNQRRLWPQRHRTTELTFERLDGRRQQPIKAEGAPLVEREGSSLVQACVVQHVHAAGADRYGVAVHRVAQRIRRTLTDRPGCDAPSSQLCECVNKVACKLLVGYDAVPTPWRKLVRRTTEQPRKGHLRLAGSAR